MRAVQTLDRPTPVVPEPPFEDGLARTASCLPPCKLDLRCRPSALPFSAGHPRLDGFAFERVLIDECAQAVEPSSLVPICRGCERLVLIGDHKQLRPTVVARSAVKKGLGLSLLERLVRRGFEPIMLNEQRRCHPTIAQVASRLFYGGRLATHRALLASPPYAVKGIAWPFSGMRILFVDTVGRTTEEKVKTSRANLKSEMRSQCDGQHSLIF
eukprot:GHVT01044563.1.p1 GENE.GHVT01044563.1~~GHVT01044563.1.p1  ORF type:complete len:213 (+),score=39.89 GHVT01044563.1:469-1107(+)